MVAQMICEDIVLNHRSKLPWMKRQSTNCQEQVAIYIIMNVPPWTNRHNQITTVDMSSWYCCDPCVDGMNGGVGASGRLVDQHVAMTERISRATSETMSSSLRWRRNKHSRTSSATVSRAAQRFEDDDHELTVKRHRTGHVLCFLLFLLELESELEAVDNEEPSRISEKRRLSLFGEAKLRWSSPAAESSQLFCGNSLTGKLPVWIYQNGSHDNSTGGIKKIQVEMVAVIGSDLIFLRGITAISEKRRLSLFGEAKLRWSSPAAESSQLFCGNSLTGKLPVWIYQNGSHDNSTGGIKKIQVEMVAVIGSDLIFLRGITAKVAAPTSLIFVIVFLLWPRDPNDLSRLSLLASSRLSLDLDQSQKTNPRSFTGGTIFNHRDRHRRSEPSPGAEGPDGELRVLGSLVGTSKAKHSCWLKKASNFDLLWSISLAP
ncbi:hypothetical protein DY000_02040891 [Brassica cretica]|uniref:Uncharacterized protein n=1 Tax=Brassica cretica TaxID=69181 RepID=A0ABQ7BKW7_BRACR|nr:hypothetical protein DY000_02040891 [Brassica cretica]